MSAGCRDCACGCCDGIHRETPLLIANRPGLSAIAYRIGTWASFRASMHAALTGQNNALSGRLTTRDDDDFSIALLDAFATVGDVLTFYQERIANEGYLRTARERLSLVELARLIGYEPAPAVAAEALLAFTIDEKATAEAVTIDAGTRVQSVPGQNETPQTFETSAALTARAEWNELKPRRGFAHPPTAGDIETYIAGTDKNLKVGDALLFTGGNTELRRIATVEPQFDVDAEGRPVPGAAGRTRVTWMPSLGSNAVHVAVMRVSAPLFGHNAVFRALIPATIVNDVGPIAASGKDWLFALEPDNTLLLDGAHPELRLGDQLALTAPGVADAFFFVNSGKETSVSHYAMSGKATKVAVANSAGLAAFMGGVYRSVVAYAGYEELPLADWPLPGFSGQTIELASPVTPFAGPRTVLITGKTTATPSAAASEAASVAGVTGTTLTLAANLANTYDPRSMQIFANVVAATHGETVKQVLGSGDATQAFQRFSLAGAPLTYVASDESPRGSKSTLSVYVNDLRWREADTLFNLPPRERAYAVSRDGDEKASVQFGDGRDQASRLPSGHDNVRAVYRKGAGRFGNVRAGQLSMLLTQPFGVSKVTNPRGADGGVDAEVQADARRNAPRTVLAIDRVVSIRDYESFSATFRGVAKALATWTWSGTAREVLLTVAGPNAEVISGSHPVRTKLIAALARFGRPHVPLRVEAFEPVKFRIRARLLVDADHVTVVVMVAVRAALEETFAFDARTFGQAVAFSEIEATIQNVEGVVAVDVDYLYRAGSTPAFHERLTAQMPKPLPGGGFQRAQILILDDWGQQDVQPKEAP
jgi:uncharacterized phage protein gp47/JayE